MGLEGLFSNILTTTFLAFTPDPTSLLAGTRSASCNRRPTYATHRPSVTSFIHTPKDTCSSLHSSCRIARDDTLGVAYPVQAKRPEFGPRTSRGSRRLGSQSRLRGLRLRGRIRWRRILRARFLRTCLNRSSPLTLRPVLRRFTATLILLSSQGLRSMAPHQAKRHIAALLVGRRSSTRSTCRISLRSPCSRGSLATLAGPVRLIFVPC